MYGTRATLSRTGVLSGLSLFLLLLIPVRLDFALSRVIDPQSVSPEQPILSRIANDLDAYGIDTVYGRSTDYPLPVGGVRVAPLAGFTPNRRDWGSYTYLTWGAAFRKGAIGFIAAVPSRESAINTIEAICIKDIVELGTDACDFVRKWVSSPSDQRVFIAFTKDDFEHANQVSKALERRAIQCFFSSRGKIKSPGPMKAWWGRSLRKQSSG